jgi:hypothetical protein
MATAKAPCILVMKKDELMKLALVGLLNVGSELEVAVSEALDVSELAADVSRLNPDVVFLSGYLAVLDKEYLGELLIQNPGLKVVVASQENNWLHIFKREDKLLTSLDELLPIIKSV